MENNVLTTIRNRTSLRVYDAKPLSQEEENLIIDSAILAPTAGNQMLYSMIIIRDNDKKRKLSKLCDYQMFIETAPLIIVFVADHHRWYDYYRLYDVPAFCEKQNIKYRTPKESDLLLAVEDTIAAAQNAVIAAESIGVGSCYIGDILENYESIKELLSLPKETFPVTMLCFGHYKKDHKRVHRDRFKRKHIVFEDTYQQLSIHEYDDLYRDRSDRFAPQNKYSAFNYAQQFYAQKTGASFSNEMERSVKAALKDWCSED